MALFWWSSLILLVVASKIDCCSNIYLLSGFVTTGKKNNQDKSSLLKIDSVTRTKINHDPSNACHHQAARIIQEKQGPLVRLRRMALLALMSTGKQLALDNVKYKYRLDYPGGSAQSEQGA
jgi:hypothetical protein